MIRLLLPILLFTGYLAFTQPPAFNCEDDSTFYPANGTRPIPALSCPTVRVITEKHLKSIYVKRHKSDSLISILKQKNSALTKYIDTSNLLIKRHKDHIDSLNVYINEKDKQLLESNAIAHKSIENTEKAVTIAKTNRALTILTLIGAVAAIVLIQIK